MRAAAAAFAWLASAAYAQETVKFTTSPLTGSREVEAVLTLPPAFAPKPFPGIVLLHTAGGTQLQVTSRYAKALAEAGFVAIEPVLFQTAVQNSVASPALAYLPKAYASLDYLAARPDVDAKRISLSGYSLGGWLTLSAATAELDGRLSSGNHFAAFAPFYPSCWWFTSVLQGKDRVVAAARFQRFVGPVKIFAGGKDDYDGRDPEACNDFVRNIPEDQRALFSVRVYPEATHGWDHLQGQTFFERAACKGRGCYNTNSPNEAVTQQSIKELIEFVSAAKQ